MISEKEKFLKSVGDKHAAGLRDMKFYPAALFNVREDDVYAELNRMDAAPDQPDEEVLGRYSPKLRATQSPTRATLRESLLAAVDVSRRLEVRCKEIPKPIEVLAQMTEEAMTETNGTKFSVTFHPRAYAAYSFLGKMELYPNRAAIFFDRNQRYCWRRFTVAKELSHILIATSSEDHLTSTPAEVSQLVTSLLAGLTSGEIFAEAPIATEYSTILMALEILLPHTHRSRFAPEGASMDIATSYRVPDQMVKLYLSKGYEELMNEVYSLPLVS